MKPHPDRPILNIVGDRIAVGPLSSSLAETVAHWHNDYAVMRNWEYLPGPRPVERMRERWEPGSIFNDPANVAFAIYETEMWDLVGFAGLHHLDHIDRIAEYFIMIGEARHRGKGYGTEATRLVLDHAFTALGLNNVLLRVFEYNLAGVRAYEKAGFRRIGVRHGCKFMGGRLWDTIYMEATAEDFESPVLRGVLVPDTPR